jgi:hypothetical protein
MPIFTHPLFLFGALAASVPLVLHLMNRQLPQRLRFPSIRFLRSARLPREGRRRLRDLPLLILRMLALVCLAVALARPVRPPAAEAGTGNSREVVILLDASASMAGFGSAQRAREQIESLLKELPGNARVGLLLSAREVLLRIPPDSDRTELLRALADYAPTKQAAEHRRALREAARLFTGPGGLLVLVSDFQRPDWQIAEPLNLPPETELRFLPTAPDARRNAGIVAVDTVPLGNETQRVVVTIRNFAAAPDQRQVKLGEGDDGQDRTVELPPLQNRRIAFVVRQQAAELVPRLDADDYPLDDSFHAWTGTRPPLSVLAITSSDREPASANAALFLRQALELPDETSPVQFQVEELDRRFLFTRELGETRLIAILGVGGECEEAEYGKLKDFLADGGTVLWTPSNSAAREFQQLWRHEIFRGRFAGLAGDHDADSFGLGWVNPETPLGQVFARPETTDLYLFPVRRYARFEPPANATVWLRFLEGDPALVDVPAGQGRLFVSALPLSVDWSDLPLTQSFLPLIRELALTAVPPGHGIDNLECGDRFPADGTENLVDTSEPRAILHDGHPLQINVSRRESVLDRINLHDLSRQLVTSPDPTATAAIGPDARRDELWFWPAALAALLVLGEMLLAHVLDQRELHSRNGQTA